MKLNTQTGSIILEAMIAILIFSIGILAMVAMQATAVNTVSDSKSRADASFLADQIIGSMWAARAASAVIGGSVFVPDTTFACNPCSLTNGNAATRAWFASAVNIALPQPNSAVIAVNINPATGTNLVTVTLNWQPPQATTPHTFVAVASIN
jgi:type IV pilus assembly protein PilV